MASSNPLRRGSMEVPLLQPAPATDELQGLEQETYFDKSYHWRIADLDPARKLTHWNPLFFGYGTLSGASSRRCRWSEYAGCLPDVAVLHLLSMSTADILLAVQVILAPEQLF